MKPKLVYICGMGHNGSTSLDLLLDLAPGIVGTSQLNDLLVLYDPKQPKNPIAELDDFWNEILTGLTPQQRRNLASENSSILKERQVLGMALSRKRRQRYARANEFLISALSNKTNADVIVDSSKNISRCLGLLESKFDVRVVHLTRDVRGYVDSHNKRRKELGQKPVYLKSTLVWLAKNVAASLFVRPKANRYIHVRYEDMMLRPEKFLQTLEEFVGTPLAACTEAIRGGAPLKPSRSLGFEGNRVLHGRTDVYLDPSRIRRDGIFESRIYWCLLGWTSSFWGYKFR